MKNPHDIIIEPVLTEKSYDAMQEKKYTFIVDKTPTRPRLKRQ